MKSGTNARNRFGAHKGRFSVPETPRETPSETPSKTMSRPGRLTHRLLGSLGAICCAVVGCQDQSPRMATSKPTPVKVVKVTQEPIQRSTVQPATVRAYHEVKIHAMVTGYVAQVNVDIGDVVKQGAVMATIDVPELDKRRQVIEAQIARCQAIQRQTQAGIDQARAEVVAAEAKLIQAKSEIDRVEASLAAAEAEFSRTQDLVNRQSIEHRLLDEIRKQRDTELASRKSTQSAIESAKADVSVARAGVSAAQAQYDSAVSETHIAERRLEETQVLLDYATLKAPFDGIVTARSVDPGTLVRRADDGNPMSALFEISQISKVRVHVAVPESQAVALTPGSSLTLSFPFFANEKPIVTSVTRISNSLDASTRTMLVEAEVDNPQGKLIPGMFGQASIETSASVAAKMLPARSVRFDESGRAYVYVVDGNNTVNLVDVTLGFDLGNRIEILSGLKTDERVIDAHRRRFLGGETVTVLPN